MLNRKFLLGTTVIAGFAVASAAWAQDAAAPAAAPEAAAPAAPAAEEDDSEVEALVITGSRIKQTEFTSAAPVQVLTSENSSLRGVADTAGMLLSSTLAAGSPQITSAISSAFVTNGGPGSSTISLRGLGANRTLVLLNGRRAGPAGVRGGVSSFDLNVIPQSSVDRIEILKDGASSIYGSDAVAGVVNIITRSAQDGGQFEAFASLPFEGASENYRANGSWGKTFDRAFVSVSGDYYLQKEQTVGDRDYTNCTRQYTFNAATKTRNDLIDPRTGEFACNDTLWGHLWIYNYSATRPPTGGKYQYDYDGDLGQYIPRTAPGLPTAPGGPGGGVYAPAPWFMVGYGLPGSAARGVQNANHPFLQEATLIPEVERGTVFVQGSYDITPDIEAYGELLLNRRVSKTNNYRQFWTYLNTSDHYYNGTTMVPGAGDPFSVGFTGAAILSPTAITDHFDSKQEVNYGRFVGGVRGSFGGFASGWEWDIFAQLSRSDGDYTQDVILADGVDDSAFRRGSCVGTTLPSGRPCQDINWLTGDFMAGRFTDAERAYLFDVDKGNTVYTQKALEGVVTGNLWKLPAGPIGAAFGFQYRTDEIEDTPGEITLSGNSWGLSAAGITAGDDTATEFFGELQIPVVKGLPGIEDLSITASSRWTDVDSYGDNTTYKLGLNWQITPGWRIRATQGTSFRAPALFELYLADQTSFLNQRTVDICINWAAALADGRIPQRIADNCAADGIAPDHSGNGAGAEVVTGGGKGLLEAETSEAKTIGLIWTPDFIDLSVALDYFEIEISDEVTQLGASNIVAQCYNSASFPTDPLCNLFQRNASNLITDIRDSFINIASQVNRGIDLTISYNHEFDFGRFSFNSQFSWQLEDVTALFEGVTVDTNGDIGDPDFVGNLNFRFDRADWTVNWAVDMIGKSSEAEDIGDGGGAYKVHNEFTAYHSLSLRKKMDDWTFLGGVANLFDEAPPAVTTLALGQYNTVGTSILGSQYDYFGRRLFLSVQKKF